MPKTTQDLATLLQSLLERAKSAEQVKQTNLLERLIKDINQLMADYSDTDLRTKKTLTEIRKSLADACIGSLTDYTDELNKSVEQLGISMMGWELMVLQDITGLTLNVPDTKAIVYAIQNRPMSVRNFTGDLLLKPFIKSLSDSTVSAIDNATLQAWSEGQTIQQLTTKLRGTKAAGYADGIIGQYMRNADAISRTAIQHSMSVGRIALWKANSDILEGYEWVSTLDSRTSTQCRALDGQVFEFDKGPLPPLHIRCRSTTKASLKDKSLEQGATRSSGEKVGSVDNRGYVDANETYYQWLKRQPESYQDLAIGPTRGKLLRDGGLSADRFAKLSLDKNFEPLSLEDMRKLVPEAFKRAGL